MNQDYISPEFELDGFHCPFCKVYAHQHWDDLSQSFRSKWHYSELDGATCEKCGKSSIWFDKLMIYPDFQGVQPPNQDLSESIKTDYQEAASILQKSPRGAAALLRLAIEKLCKDLGENSDDLNTDIKNLVLRGLPSGVQKSLDVVRVIGNEAVHPGQIDLNDDIEIAKSLFKLINIVAEKMITEIKELDEIYNSLPESKRAQIEKRDEQK